MAFLLVGLCTGLAGLASGYEKLAPMLEGLGAKLPMAIVEAPGVGAGDGEFDPQVLMAGLPLGQHAPGAPTSQKPAPGVVIFGPGGNGPEIDVSKMRSKSQIMRERLERPPVKDDSLVLVRDSDEPTHRR